MKRFRLPIWSTVALVLFLAAPMLRAEESHDTSHYVLPETVKGWLTEGQTVTFLDVREADEFQAGHIPGARNIPHHEVQGFAADLPHDQPIVVYCIHSAHRAPDAAKTLRQLGFQNAYVMEGGIVAWEAGGQTLRAGDLTQTPKILPVTERCENKQRPSS